MKKVVTIGSVMRDVFITYQANESLHLKDHGKQCSYIMLETDKKIELSEVNYTVGGGAANTAVSFARLGFDVSIICKVGKDQEADHIVNHLATRNINIDNVVRTDQAITGTSFIMPFSAVHRCVLVYRGANTLLAEQDININVLQNADALHFGPLSGQAALLLPKITTIAYKNKALVAVNPGTGQLLHDAALLRQALPYINILILNKHEAQLLINAMTMVSGATTQVPIIPGRKNLPELLARPLGEPSACFTLSAFFEAVMEQGPEIVIVTNGNEGVYVGHGSSIYFHPSVAATIVNTVGAGDAFASTFTAIYLNTHDIGMAIRMAMVNCAHILMFHDTQTGLLPYQELEKKMQAIDQSLLDEFKNVLQNVKR